MGKVSQARAKAIADGRGGGAEAAGHRRLVSCTTAPQQMATLGLADTQAGVLTLGAASLGAIAVGYLSYRAWALWKAFVEKRSANDASQQHDVETGDSPRDL